MTFIFGLGLHFCNLKKLDNDCTSVSSWYTYSRFACDGGACLSVMGGRASDCNLHII